jgi:hypothetical protein
VHGAASWMFGAIMPAGVLLDNAPCRMSDSRAMEDRAWTNN